MSTFLEAYPAALALGKPHKGSREDLVYKLVALMVALAMPAIATDNQQHGRTHSDIDRVSQRFDQAQFERNRSDLERLLSPRLRYINGRGERGDRAAFLPVVLESTARLNPFEIRERDITFMGNGAAAVTGYATVSGSTADERYFEQRMRYVDIFEYHEDRWQVVYIQVTPALS